MKTNNILDEKGRGNFLFLASVIATLCKDKPLIVDLRDILLFWNGEIKALQYDLFADANTRQGTIVFSLKEKKNED